MEKAATLHAMKTWIQSLIRRRRERALRLQVKYKRRLIKRLNRLDYELSPVEYETTERMLAVTERRINSLRDKLGGNFVS